MAETTDTPTPVPPRLRPEDLGRSGRRIDVDFGQALRAGLCNDFDLVSVETFVATIKARRWRRDGLIVTGDLTAVATRTSVVGLDLFRETTKVEFERRFQPQPAERSAEPGAFHVDDDDPPDRLPPEGADLVALLREEFALALEPNPRKPGEAFAPEFDARTSDEGAARNPFSVLDSLADDTQDTS